MNMSPSSLMQCGLIATRVALWIAIFTLLLFGLFTFPAIMVGGFILVYLLYYYVQHSID